ncbi:MAG: homoserine dehydrogenase, partial [Acidobacteriota bacterium]
KTLLAHSGLELQTLAARRGTTFAFDAAVLAGVPFLGSLSRRPLVSAAQTIAGVLNGTSNFILTRMAEGAAFEDALGEAVVRGYAEPDSSADVTGLDAAQKLAILLHVAGCGDVCSGDLPRASLDIVDPRDLAAARRLGGVIKPLAFASLDPMCAGAWVGPAFLEDGHPFRGLNGVTNALQLTSSTGHAVTFAGPGTGPEVTATTILDDVVEVVMGPHVPFVRPAADIATSTACLSQPPNGRWFVRVGDRSDVRPAHLAEFLAASGMPALHLIEESGRCAALTVPAHWTTARDVIGDLRASCSNVLAIPAFDGARDE